MTRPFAAGLVLFSFTVNCGHPPPSSSFQLEPVHAVRDAGQPDDGGLPDVHAAADAGTVLSRAWVTPLNEYLTAGLEAADGTLVVAGARELNSASNRRSLWVSRLTSAGATLWQKAYELPGSTGASSLVEAADGETVVAGDAILSNGPEGWVLRLTRDGDVRWQTRIPAAERLTGIVDVGGAFIAVGFTGGDEGNAQVIRLGPDGTQEWVRSIGGAGVDRALGVVKSPAGVLVYGQSGAGGWLAEVSPTGQTLRQATITAIGQLTIRGVAYTSDGEWVAAGWIKQTQHDYEDGLVFRLSDDWKVRWARSVRQGLLRDTFSAIAVDGENFIAAGRARFASTGGDLWLVKLDSDGVPIWDWRYARGVVGQGAAAVRMTAAGEVLVSGWTSHSEPRSGNDAWMLRLQADGSLSSPCDSTQALASAPQSQSQLLVVDGTPLPVSDGGAPGAGTGATPYAMDTSDERQCEG